MALSRCIFVLVLSLAAPAQALPEDPGKLSFLKVTRTEQLAGKAVTFDLYLPQKLATPAPVVAVGHGFQRKRGNMAGWGEGLARRGYVAAVPDFPGLFPDHALNGQVIASLLSWLVAEAGRARSSIHGKVDPTRRGVVGFSAGGLAAVLAAAADPHIDLAVGIDPVDNNGLGVIAAAKIKAPVLFVRAEPGSCNSNGNAAAIFAALAGPRLSLKVAKATHCDGESPSGALCALTCGAHDEARHKLFRRYAHAALDYHLRCEMQMAPWLGGASALSDPGIEDLVAAGFLTAPVCASDQDGGTPADAGPADLTPGIQDLNGQLLDGAWRGDAGTHGDIAVNTDDHPGDGAGCSCQVPAGDGRGPDGGWGLIVLYAWLWRRARADRQGPGT